MIVSLNGFVINDGSTGAYLDVEVDGLELPSIRTSTGNYSGRDGGYIGAQFYAARDITLQGSVFSQSIATLEATRKTFMAALKGKSITLGVISNAGASYIVYCNLIDFQMPINKSLFMANFKIELLAPDPTIYDNTSGGANVANIYKAASGGRTYPKVYPYTYTGGGLPTTVTNNGTTSVFPSITLTGSMTNPVITNQTTGLTFSLTPLTTGTSDQVVINMNSANRSVLLNGGNIYGLKGPGSSFWSLAPGNNSIQLTTSGGGDTVTGTVSWRSGYTGI